MPRIAPEVVFCTLKEVSSPIVNCFPLARARRSIRSCQALSSTYLDGVLAKVSPVEIKTGFQFIDFSQIPGISCPCGTARRALMDEPGVPFSLHVTEISLEAKAHYHKRTSEVYFILECGPTACIELDGVGFPVRPHDAVAIYPGTRHRAVGQMKVVIIATPKFDSDDEWLD